MYVWIETLHIVAVIGWMAAVFYLPRILVNLAEVGNEPVVRARLMLMGRRLARFGQAMFGFVFVFGMTLWMGWRFLPGFQTMVGTGSGWLHAKLLLVALMFAYSIVMGRWLKGAEAGKPLPSSRVLRWINEIPLVFLIGIVYMVVAKPF